MAKRIFYSVQAIGICAEGSASPTLLHGADSASIETSFNLQPVFELGQLEIYDNIEDIPDISMSIEKKLDGYPPAYILATQGSSASDLAGRSVKKCNILFSVFDDSQQFASGTPLASVMMSGMFSQNIAYSFPVDGNFTESVTFVGNNKSWYSSPGASPLSGASLFGPSVDSPYAVGASGGVNRRQHLQFYPPVGVLTTDANGVCNDNRVTVLPTQIPGISASGFNLKSGGDYAVHVQSINVSTNLGREPLYELGRRAPYHRYVTFPTEVTCAIEVLATSGDGISGTEFGGTNGAGAGSNLTNQSIRIRTREGLYLDLGVKNKIASVTESGGDTGGGNRTITYNFTNYNALDIKHIADPTTGLRPSHLTSAQISTQDS